jgi:hypothetical protein
MFAPSTSIFCCHHGSVYLGGPGPPAPDGPGGTIHGKIHGIYGDLCGKPPFLIGKSSIDRPLLIGKSSFIPEIW